MSEGLLTLGETMGLFRAERSGTTEHQEEFRLGIGGAESNVAIGVARLGGRARWCGRIGADGVGRRIDRELRAEGVDARVIVDQTAPTGLMVKTRPVPALVRVDYHRAASAGSRLSPEDVTDDLFDGVGILHVTGITPALSETAARATVRAVERARELGVRVSFDVNHREGLWPGTRAQPTYRKLTALSDLVFAGDDEMMLLSDRPRPEDRAQDVAASGADVIVKLGGEGAYALLDGRPRRVAAVPIDPVDTVGAGDAFVAGFLADTLAGATAEEALVTAVRAGAFACLGAGDWESLPRRDDLRLLHAQDPVLR